MAKEKKSAKDRLSVAEERLAAWKGSPFRWVLVLAFCVVFAGMVGYSIFLLWPQPATAGVGACEVSVKTTATYSPVRVGGHDSMTPAVPRTETREVSCSSGAMPAWAIGVGIGLLALLVIPELAIIGGEVRAKVPLPGNMEADFRVAIGPPGISQTPQTESRLAAIEDRLNASEAGFIAKGSKHGDR